MEQDDSLDISGTSEYRNFFRSAAIKDLQGYRRLYKKSTENRENFWSNEAARLLWDSKFRTVVEEDFSTGSIAWFLGGKLNACKNALDRNLEQGMRNTKALVYYGNDMSPAVYTYQDIYDRVRVLAGALEARGLKQGDRVALYLPDCPETVMFMLACSRLGIVYVPIPSRFTSEVASEIVSDCGAVLLVEALDSAQQSYRERAWAVREKVRGVTIVTTGSDCPEGAVLYSDFFPAKGGNPSDTIAAVDSEHPLFIIYANSAAGIPRGSVFATGGFLVQAAASFDYLFGSTLSQKKNKGILCTLNLAAVATQCYGLWGPLINGSFIEISAEDEEATCTGIHTLVQSSDSSIFFTTPRVIAALKRELSEKNTPAGCSFSLIVCCGDVLTPRLVSFAGSALTTGPERVLNLWIQSESGCALIATYPEPSLNQAGCLGLPFFAISPKSLNNMGESCKINESGQLVFASSWPSMIRTIWGQAERYRDLYFRRIPGCFATNDGVRVDSDGFFWFMGRLDDVIKVMGQSLATSEIEAVLVEHHEIREAAVVSITSEEGDNLCAFIAVESGKTDSEKETLIKEINSYIIQRIGEFALPGTIIFTSELPRTRTGKVVRRILRRVATGDISSDEDLSHVANPQSITDMIRRKG